MILVSSVQRVAFLALVLIGVLVGGGCNRAPAPAPPTPQHETTTLASASTTPSLSSTDGRRAEEVAILAGGCFWGMEELLRTLPGVISTEVGYSGGTLKEPRYQDVKQGDTGHAEAVSITFNPQLLSYEALLLHYFKIHDPTTKDRQGNDVGMQYRSAIFVTTEAQRRVALSVIERVNKSGAWDTAVTTEVVDATTFTPAEEYHQDYLQKNPNGYTCHFEREVTY